MRPAAFSKYDRMVMWPVKKPPVLPDMKNISAVNADRATRIRTPTFDGDH